MTTPSYQEIADGLQRQFGLSREDAERAARRAVSPVPVSQTVPGSPAAAGERVLDATELGKLEKAIEAEGDKIVRALGGKVVRFSHPGRTKQTPGIADRWYGFPRLRLGFWWEWKAPEGVQSPDQKLFQEDVTSCGDEYGIGGLGDFKAWLTAHRVAVFDANGNPIPWPEDA